MIVCDTNGWLAAVGCLLLSPQTAVDVVSTLFGALLAAGVALIILRGQLRHDRALAESQSARELLIAKAAADRPYVDTLGNALIDMRRALDAASHVVGRELLDEDRGDRHSEVFDLWQRLSAHIELHPSDIITDLWRDIVHHRDWCAAEARFLVDNDRSEDVMLAVGMAAESALYEVYDRAVSVGAALLRWDGVSALDLLAFAPPMTDPTDVRKERAVGEFQRVMDRYLYADTNAVRRVRARLQRRDRTRARTRAAE